MKYHRIVTNHCAREGKLAEYWNVTHNVNIFKQIGAIEYTEKGKQILSEDAK